MIPPSLLAYLVFRVNLKLLVQFPFSFQEISIFYLDASVGRIQFPKICPFAWNVGKILGNYKNLEGKKKSPKSRGLGGPTDEMFLRYRVTEDHSVSVS